MRNKKRRLCLLLCLLMAAGLCSCARASDNAPDSAEQETGAVAPSGALKLSDPERIRYPAGIRRCFRSPTGCLTPGAGCAVGTQYGAKAKALRETCCLQPMIP